MQTARTNIFDLMAQNYNLSKEVLKIEDFYKRLNLEWWLNSRGLKQWKNIGTIIDIDELEEKLGIEKIMDNADDDEKQLSVQEALIYIEYVLNMIYLYESKYETKEGNKDYETLMGIINNLLGHVNYKIEYFKEEEKVLIVEKNLAAQEVAELVDKKTALNVIEYNHHLLKGNLEKKKLILKTLADEAEGIRGREKGALDDFMYLANNTHIRHNNKKGTKKQEYLDTIGDEELEKLYDTAYKLYLIGRLDYEYNTILKSEVENIKKLLPHK